jgi:hypothetical protein
MCAITVFFLVLNLFILFPEKKLKKIVQSKPTFWGNHRISVILTWMFFLLSVAIMFFLGNAVQNILAHCGKR